MNAGDAGHVRREIIVNGVVAFQRNQLVTVEKVDPNPQRPEYKYVVYSRDLERRFQLTDDDIEQAPSYIAPRPAAQPFIRQAMAPAPTKGKLARALDWAKRRDNRTIVVAAGLILLMFMGYGVYTIIKSGASAQPEGVAKQLFEMGEGKDLKGMMALIDPAKAGLLQPQFEYRFINNKFGQGFTRVLVYTPVEDGNTATVTLTVPSQYIQGKLAGSTVKVADIKLTKVNGKWMVSDVLFGAY
jgi:hypothetical protein